MNISVGPVCLRAYNLFFSVVPVATTVRAKHIVLEYLLVGKALENCQWLQQVFGKYGRGLFFISVTPLNIAYYHHHESYRNHGCSNGGYYFISQHPELKHYKKDLLMLDMQDM